MHRGLQSVEQGGALSLYDAIEIDAAGRAVLATAPDRIVGMVLEVRGVGRPCLVQFDLDAQLRFGGVAPNPLPWSPMTIDPVLWLDGSAGDSLNVAADGTGASPAIEGNVARWASQVGDDFVSRSTGTLPTWSGSGVVFGPAADFLSNVDNKYNGLHDGTGGAVFLRVVVDALTAGQQVLMSTNNRSSGSVGITLEINVAAVRTLVSAGSGWLITSDIVAGIEAGTLDIVYSLDGTDLTIWVDGTEGSGTLSGAPSTDDHAASLTIGDDGTRDLAGIIEQVVIIDRAATEADVGAFSSWSP